MIQRLGMVIIRQSNLDEAISFYKDILGLPPRFKVEGVWAEFDLGNTRLGLCPTQDAIEGTRTGVVLEVRDLKKTYKAWKHMGVTFLNEPVEKVHGIMVSFMDPSGNHIDLYQPTPDRVTSLVETIAAQDE
ncbi:VOC family protein [Candidatus Babeliales bacterium]|nr:VOC family protein [Candidatus Babeliales bacterium]